MKKMTILFFLVFLFVFGAIKSFGADQSEKLSIVTLQYYHRGFDLWKYNLEEKIFQKTFSNLLTHIDKDYYEKYRREGLLGNRFGIPVISDIDNDGENEFVAIDRFGIIVCGQSPKYFAFEKSGKDKPQILVEDLDKDGSKEFITQRILYFNNDSPEQKRLVQIWKIKDGKLNEIWSQIFPGRVSWTLLYEDVDNDGEKELITAYDTITILKKRTLYDWYVAADLPNIGTVIDVVRIGDVDGDGKNEIMATGNSGALTVYKYQKDVETGNESYPVMWQSPPLLNEDLKPSKYRKPRVFTQGLGIGDIDNDGQIEILVGTTEDGIFPDGERRAGGKIHVFKYKEDRTFLTQWISDWTTDAVIPAIAVGDVDGDQKNEFVYLGQEVYKYNDQHSQYEKIAELDPTAFNAVIGQLPNLKEPMTSLRIIPIRLDLKMLSPKPGQTYEGSLSILNVWAEANNVSFSLRTDSDYLKIENGHQKLGLMKSGEIIDSQPISVRIAEAKLKDDEDLIEVVIWFEITAEGGYKQSTPKSFWIDFTE